MLLSCFGVYAGSSCWPTAIEFFIVACSFVLFHSFIIVNNYIERSQNELQQKSTIWTIGNIISTYQDILMRVSLAMYGKYDGIIY